MPSYKLIYFNVRGRGELIRYLFVAAGVEYEDYRLQKDQWADLKPKMPMGFLPVLEIDGEQLSQSLTIARYVAREFGLHGKTSLEQARVDEIADTCSDLRTAVRPAYWEQDEIKKAEMWKKLFEGDIPKYLGILQKILEKNNGGTAFFIGSSLTLADLIVYDYVSWPLNKDPKLFGKYPSLQVHRKRVSEVPAIAKWLKERPETVM